MTLIEFDRLYSIYGSIYILLLLLIIIELVDSYRIGINKLVKVYITIFSIMFLLIFAGIQTKLFSVINGNGFINSELIELIKIGSLAEFFSIIFVGYHLLHYNKNHISKNAIKEGLDYLDGGLCYYNEDGRILLINEYMNNLVEMLPEASIYNGISIWESVKNLNLEQLDYDVTDNIMIVKLQDEKYYKFVLSEKDLEHRKMYEIIATDVTVQEQLNRQLIEENHQLQQLNHRLKQYNYDVEKLIREEEILNAKINLHDSFGKLLLSANRSMESNSSLEDKKATLKLWKQNLSLINIQNNDDHLFTNDFAEIKDVAKSVGVNIHFNNEVTINDKKLYDVFFTAIHECLTNTVAHAKGENLYVSFIIEKDNYHIELSNDGQKPEKMITFGGGLNNLNKKVLSLNGRLSVSIDPVFTIIINIPIEVNSYER